MKIARLRRFGDERDKTQKRERVETEKHKIPYQGLLQKYGDLKQCLDDEEIQDLLIPEDAFEWIYTLKEKKHPTKPDTIIKEKHWWIRTWIDQRGFINDAMKDGYENLKDPERMAERISKYVKRRDKERGGKRVDRSNA